MSFGALAFAQLFEQTARAQEKGFANPLAAKPPHFTPKVKRVVHLFMNGGPSQVDTFDPKPTLRKYDRADWGRDHNNHGFTMWLAGGGVKKGFVYGATDEFGFAAAENPIHVHDLHATLLHLLGFDHERLTYRYAGRDFRLTDVQGLVVKDLLA